MSANFTNVESCPVYDKVPAIFVCAHVEGTETEKFGRNGQKYLATPQLNSELISYLTVGLYFKPTAKIDGTSMIVRDGALLKRRDRKQKWDKKKRSMVLKDMPKTWIQTGLQTKTHGVGYMPLEKGDTWFFDVFERDPNEGGLENKIGHPLIDESPSTRVRIVEIADSKLVYRFVELSELNGKSFELVGPKIQCNTHGLEYHALMEHGVIECTTFPDISGNTGEDLLEEIREWHRTDPLGSAVEGIVLHFDNGKMFKLHRHHLDMEWGHHSTEQPTPLFDLVL
jgi:Family of unknown function (DUF5565)